MFYIYYAGLSGEATDCNRVFSDCLFVAVLVCVCSSVVFSQSFLLCIGIDLRKIVKTFFEKVFQAFTNNSSLSELLLKLEICNLRQRPYLIKLQACSMQFQQGVTSSRAFSHEVLDCFRCCREPMI